MTLLRKGRFQKRLGGDTILYGHTHLPDMQCYARPGPRSAGPLSQLAHRPPSPRGRTWAATQPGPRPSLAVRARSATPVYRLAAQWPDAADSVHTASPLEVTRSEWRRCCLPSTLCACAAAQLACCRRQTRTGTLLADLVAMPSVYLRLCERGGSAFCGVGPPRYACCAAGGQNTRERDAPATDDQVHATMSEAAYSKRNDAHQHDAHALCRATRETAPSKTERTPCCR